jgi:hypothetical protein
MCTMIYEFVIRFQRSISSRRSRRRRRIGNLFHQDAVAYTLKRTERIACSQYSQPTRHAREPSHN